MQPGDRFAPPDIKADVKNPGISSCRLPTKLVTPAGLSEPLRKNP